MNGLSFRRVYRGTSHYLKAKKHIDQSKKFKNHCLNIWVHYHILKMQFSSVLQYRLHAVWGASNAVLKNPKIQTKIGELNPPTHTPSKLFFGKPITDMDRSLKS